MVGFWKGEMFCPALYRHKCFMPSLIKDANASGNQNRWAGWNIVLDRCVVRKGFCYKKGQLPSGWGGGGGRRGVKQEGKEVCKGRWPNHTKPVSRAPAGKLYQLASSSGSSRAGQMSLPLFQLKWATNLVAVVRKTAVKFLMPVRS